MRPIADGGDDGAGRNDAPIGQLDAPAVDVLSPMRHGPCSHMRIDFLAGPRSWTADVSLWRWAEEPWTQDAMGGPRRNLATVFYPSRRRSWSGFFCWQSFQVIRALRLWRPISIVRTLVRLLLS